MDAANTEKTLNLAHGLLEKTLTYRVPTQKP